MKACLPIMGDTNLKKELVANDFYKAQHYCIYDFETNSSSIYSLTDTNTIYMSISEIKKLDIQIIITPNLRPMAAKILFENEIEVYKAVSNVVGENIDHYNRGLLRDFTAAMIESKQDCSPDACSSCSSSGSCN
ncbi:MULTISPECIES: NifB/NifX family molybdenum-iron cluster-binding protein [unclassified Saccharicrinis]|uniref:NifB/NifX family molybdenum-iron cluster-binding protein n=1 Tax=unclassified Saccharicrinis TaxID=2646859 RepID=UPI003D325E14